MPCYGAPPSASVRVRYRKSLLTDPSARADLSPSVRPSVYVYRTLATPSVDADVHARRAADRDRR